MGAPFSEYRVLRGLASLLGMDKNSNGPTQVNDREAIYTVDMGQGGYLNRDPQLRELTRNIGLLTEPTLFLVDKHSTINMVWTPGNGTGDLRIMGANARIQFDAAGWAALPESTALRYRYYIGPDPDGTASVDVMVVERMAIGSTFDAAARYPVSCPLTGVSRQSFGFDGGADPAVARTPGQVNLACTWDRFLPVSWWFRLDVSLLDERGVPIAFPVNTLCLIQLAAITKPPSTELPR